MMRRFAILAAAGGVACGGGGGYQQADTVRTDTTPAVRAQADTGAVLGMVESFGVDPMTYPVVRGADAVWRLDGPLAAELGRVTGAEVSVRGTREAEQPHGRLVVSSYDIVSVNGRPVEVGVLEAGAEGLMLQGARAWRLVGAPPALADLVGAKVYVVGNRADGVLTVESWGVIRDP